MSSVFKSVEESIELYKQGVEADTGFSYMYNCEEVAFDEDGFNYEFDIKGDIKYQLECIEEVGYAGPIVASDDQRPYDEFTQIICPAYKAE